MLSAYKTPAACSVSHVSIKEDSLHAICPQCVVPPMSVKSHAWTLVQHVTT